MNPTTTRGQYGNITTYGNGGVVYSDPRDNPGFSGYVPPSSTSTNRPVGDVFKPFKYQETESDQIANRNYKKTQGYSEDPESYRRNYINMFQDRINALNQVYDQQLAKTQAEGKGRVGQGTAVLARRGLSGTPRGGAIQEGVLDVNREAEASVQAERNAAIGAIMGKASEMAVEEARAKSEAKRQGAESYLEHLKTQETRKEGYIDENVRAVLASGLEIDGVADSIAKELGVSREQVLFQYKKAVKEKDEADYAREGTDLDRKKIQADIDMAEKEFEENKRQFGLDYALRAREQALAEINARNKAAEDEKGKEDPELALQNVEDQIKTLDDLLASDGLEAAVGPNRFARFSGLEPFNNKRGDYVAGIEKLTSQLTMDKLVSAKQSGATFGSLTDGERLLLAAAATKINSYANKDKDGKVVSYKATEDQFKEELKTIKKLAERDKKRRTKNIIKDDEKDELDEEFGDEGSFYDN